MKLSTKDLMLGDWYQWYAEGQYYYYQVSTETFKEDTTNFEPIPLTLEILEKNGFSVGSNMSIYRDDEFDDCEITFWNFEKFCIVQNYKTKVEIDFFCKSVHELQHALKLCGINKNINV